MSRIGKKPIAIPKGVTVKVEGNVKLFADQPQNPGAHDAMLASLGVKPEPQR